MYRWTDSDGALIITTADSLPAAEKVYQFGAEQSNRPVLLCLDLTTDSDGASVPELAIDTTTANCRIEIADGKSERTFRISILVPPASDLHQDDEVVIRLAGESHEVPPCRLVLRRSTCKIGTALIERHRSDIPLRKQTRAALLWYSWKRYQEIVGLKPFTSGKSGSDVLVFRPRLRDPDSDSPLLKRSFLPEVFSNSWGSYLLVKTGETSKVQEEWDRFQTFLMDRLHPFMARSESCLHVRPDGESPELGSEATLIGSFLGGDLLQAESLELFIQGTSDFQELRKNLEKLFSTLSMWYAGSVRKPLEDWIEMFGEPNSPTLNLFGKYNLRKREDREQYTHALSWDIDFSKEDHLSHHLFGKKQDGLLYRLKKIDVQYSLTHGDLHPKNVLSDGHNIWLIDFGKTGISPTLFDFAKLEVYLRLWCLQMKPGVTNFDDTARKFETHLLDNITASEGSLEPVRSFASNMGVSPVDLLKIAHCVSFIRKEAIHYSLGSPDRRDYLAVLYITVLKTLSYAESASGLAENFRLLVGLLWVLEDALSLMVGMKAFERGRADIDLKRIVNRHWLAAPGAPARIVYFLNRPDGQMALEPLAATRGILQSQIHHLDVFDHTLLVVAYLERLLGDPLAGLMDPANLDHVVNEDLRNQGIRLPGFSDRAIARGTPDISVVQNFLEDIRKVFSSTLNDENQLLLKWTGLFHDVGKPATRGMFIGREAHKTQFLGHELYGPHLVNQHLLHLYPEPDLRNRATLLIRKHLLPVNLVNRYSDPENLDAAKNGLTDHLLSTKELHFLHPLFDSEENETAGDFPLLVLHGYADILACRGQGVITPVSQVAEIYLILLALYAHYPVIKERLAVAENFETAIKGLFQTLNMKGEDFGRLKNELKSWYISKSFSASKMNEISPTAEEVRQKALEIRDQMGIQSRDGS